MSSAGGVLDPSGVAISAATGFQGEPSIASDGTSYLVTAEDQRLGTRDIVATLVSAGGTVLNTGVSLGAEDDEDPAVASNGSGFLAGWTRTENIVGGRVSSAGAALDSTPFTISKSANSQFAPAVAFDGTNYLVVWEDSRAPFLYGARVTPRGTMLDGSGFVISSACARPVESRRGVRRHELSGGVAGQPIGRKRHLRHSGLDGWHRAGRRRHPHLRECGCPGGARA